MNRHADSGRRRTAEPRAERQRGGVGSGRGAGAGVAAGPFPPPQAGIAIRAGSPLPLGVSERCDGFNFALFSRHAEGAALLLFADTADVEPAFALDLDPAEHRTGDVWHVLVQGIAWGQAYAWRVDGPWAPEQGHRFMPHVALLDPCGPAVVGTQWWDFARLAAGVGAEPSEPPEAPPPSARSLLVDRRFDWQGVRRPKRSWAETVIYETHVRGLTIDPSSGSAHPGTFLGVVDKIPYLQELGITAVELMPVHEFNSRGIARADPASGRPLRNYWGYDTAAFFAPKESYGSGRAPGCQLDEFKTMVRELHRAGIEVILDVVFNHTAEGGADGPTLSFRGLDNAIYYLLDADGGYLNFSGCGNTVNCNHPVVRDFIIDCLRYWVAEMQLDGFRFDLASILGRGEGGELLQNPPLLERIAEDPLLRDVNLIAEAWDAGGAFQLGRFPGQRWAEWNCHFRDDVRRFWRGDAGMRGAFASRLCGSADIYRREGKAPLASLNFVACHDGFTLNDVVSYRRKHNEANGEENRDGPPKEFGANYGVEGETGDPEIERIRLRQIKNMLATLLLSRGVPMILGGDEFRRTQAGNSNAYCQDNETSWYDWRLVESNAELRLFVRELIALRGRHAALRSDAFYTARDLIWFDRDGSVPVWDGPDLTLGVVIAPEATAATEPALCLLCNPDDAPATFALPRPPHGGAWRRLLDTGLEWPNDICKPEEAAALTEPDRYAVSSRTMVLLSAQA